MGITFIVLILTKIGKMVDKLKIAHVIPSLSRGGAERLVIDICRELHKRDDVEYRLVVLNKKNQYEELTGDLNIVYCNVKVVTFRLESNRNNLDQWKRFLEAFEPDIIHSHIFFADLVSRAFIQPGVKYFSHLHGRTTQYEKLNFTSLFFTPRRSLQHIAQKGFILSRYKKSNTLFFAVSGFYKDYLERNLGLKKNVTVLPNAIDYSRFFCSKKRKLEEPLKLISAGRLVEHKNHKFLIEVCKILKKRGVAFKLEIMGDGELREELSRQILQSELEGLIFLPGVIKKPEEKYCENHIYVHSATDEPFGLVFLEAMAAGLPVITLDGKGNRDLIIQRKNGFLLFEQDAEKFANKIMEVWENKTLYKEMSDFAQEFARKHDIKDYVDRLKEIYLSSIKKPK